MSQHNRFSFPLAGIFLATAMCALFFASGLSFWLVLLVTILIAICVCVELLTQGIPAKLRDLSRANCFRMDGTLSSRRSAREQKAVGKVRTDMWAIFLIVAFIGTGGLFVLQSTFPMTLVDDVVSAARDDSGGFKLALKKRGVDDQFFRWARRTSRSSNAEIREWQQWLWVTWPVVLGLSFSVFVGCLALVRFAYLRALRDLHAGVAARSKEYLNLDMGRLQG